MPRRLGIDAAEVGRMYQGGRTIRQIATALGCSDMTVHNHLIRAGIGRRSRGRRRATGERPDALAEEIIRRYVSGQKGEAIAAELGLATAAVYRRLRRHGIAMRPKGHRARGPRVRGGPATRRGDPIPISLS